MQEYGDAVQDDDLRESDQSLRSVQDVGRRNTERTPIKEFDIHEATLKDDQAELPNMLAGQSNSNKKGKLAGMVRFKGEDGSESSNGSSVNRRRRGTFSDVDGQSGITLSKEGQEDKARKEFERFYPVFRQIYRL